MLSMNNIIDWMASIEAAIIEHDRLARVEVDPDIRLIGSQVEMRVHINCGIEKIARAVETQIEVGNTQNMYQRVSFWHNGIEYFQLNLVGEGGDQNVA